MGSWEGEGGGAGRWEGRGTVPGILNEKKYFKYFLKVQCHN